jgi:hypothetical protein
VRDAGVVLCLVAVIVLLLSVAARADEAPAPVVLDVGEGVTCQVPGVRGPVPLPPGKLVPLVLWWRLDDRLRVLEAELARERAERAEQERQFGEALTRVAAVSVVAGIVAALGFSWVAARVP